QMKALGSMASTLARVRPCWSRGAEPPPSARLQGRRSPRAGAIALCISLGAEETPMGDAGPELLPTPRWVRALFGGQVVASSRRALLHRPPRGRLVYWFPRDDVRVELLQEAGAGSADPRLGTGMRFTVTAGERQAVAAALS